MKKTLFIILSTVFIACNENTQEIQVDRLDYHHAMNQLTEVMIHDVFSPPVASRIYAYPSIAAYQVLNNENTQSEFKSLEGQLNELDKIEITSYNEKVNLNLAALIAYLDVSKELVFSDEMITQYRDSLYDVWREINKKEFTISKTYGLEISSQIIDWMNEDGYNETRTLEDYNIFTDDISKWKPTPPAYMDGIEPSWNKIRPFVLDSASQFIPKPHPPFSMEEDSDFYKELLFVYNTINQTIELGDDSEEIAIARFWDCNPFVSVNVGHYLFAEKKITPGAHWLGICAIASDMNNASLSEAVYAQTKTSIAISDAFISCWDEKYRSNLVRPETLINEFIDPTWHPILQTPPFPEYTSGHSVVSNASAEVLTAIFGDDFSYTDTVELPYGLPERSYDSFYHAAEEASISRIYGGIHYESAVYEGQSQGKKVGQLVNKKIQFK